MSISPGYSLLLSLTLSIVPLSAQDCKFIEKIPKKGAYPLPLGGKYTPVKARNLPVHPPKEVEDFWRIAFKPVAS